MRKDEMKNGRKSKKIGKNRHSMMIKSCLKGVDILATSHEYPNVPLPYPGPMDY